MNRFQMLAADSQFFQQSEDKIEQALLSTTWQRGADHTLFVPLHYERNYAYPLLVWLHGQGDDQRQLQRVMPLISMRNYVAVGPRAASASGGDAAGYQWRQTPHEIELAESAVFACIEAAQEKFHISPQRIFIAGYGCGGTMALRLGLKHPERFAGALSIGGPLSTENVPLLYLKRARELPLFIAQGRDALEYSIEQTCRELCLFHTAGMSVTLRQYPCGDELTTQMLHDLDVWIMERVTGTPTSDEQIQWLHLAN